MKRLALVGLLASATACVMPTVKRDTALRPVEPLVATPSGAIAATPPSLPPLPAIEAPTVNVSELPHGVALWVAERPRAAVATVCVVFRRGGWSHDLARTWQLEGLAAVFRNAQGMGDLSAEVHSRSLNVCRTADPAEAPEVAKALVRMAVSPRLGEAAANARRNLEATLLQRLRNTSRFAALRAHQLLFGAADLEETFAGLERVTSEALHRELAQPADIALIATGKVEGIALQQAITPLLEAWSPGEAVEPFVPPARGQPQRQAFVVEAWRKSYPEANVALAIDAPPLGNEDGPAYRLFVEILTNPFRGRLRRRLRTAMQSTYGVKSRLKGSADHGALWVVTALDAERTADATVALIEELERLLQAPVEAQELVEAKAQLRSRARAARHRSFRLAKVLSDHFAAGQSPEAIVKQDQALEAVTAQEVTAVAQRYLGQHSPVVVLGNDAIVDALLADERLEVVDADPPTEDEP